MMEVTMEHQHVSDDIFAYANTEQCRDAFSLVDDLLRNIPDSGWWIMSRIKKLQLCAKFDHNSEKAKNVLNTIMTIIDKYYINAESHLKKLCREENISENEYSTTSNEIIVNFRNKYANTISQGELICLDIPLDDLSTILVNLNSIFVGLCILTMQFKKASVANNIQHAVHVPMFIPFNHNTDLLFHKFTIKPNPQFLNLAVTEPNDDWSKTPYMFVSGYVALICESGDSRGTNSAGKHFKVLNLVEPSLTMLRDHFNSYIRRRFPESFPVDKMSPNMFVQLSKSQSTPNISCMAPHRGKRYLLVLANLANIYLVQNVRGQPVPQLQIWTNVKLGD
jgi:hypothetical protein